MNSIFHPSPVSVSGRWESGVNIQLYNKKVYVNNIRIVIIKRISQYGHDGNLDLSSGIVILKYHIFYFAINRGKCILINVFIGYQSVTDTINISLIVCMK